MGPPARNQHLGRQWRPAFRWALPGAIAAIVLALVTAMALPYPDDDTAGHDLADLSDPVVSLLWRALTGQPVTSPPTITDGGVFLGGVDGTIRGFATDGREIWTYPAASGKAVYVRASGKGVVYATTAGGAVVAVDAVTGSRLWGKKTATTFDAPPALSTDRVFAAGRDSSIYSYLARSGGSRRKAWAGDEILTEPTVIKEAAVVASTDERVYVLPGGSYARWRPRIGRPAGAPIPAGDAACTPLTDGSVRCVRITDGRVLPRMTLPGTTLSAAASDGDLLFAAGGNGAIGAWDLDTGAQRWSVPPAGPAGVIRLVRHKDSVVVTYPDGRLAGLDAAAGTLRWEVTLPDRFDTAPRIGNGAAYVVGRTGTLYALQIPELATTAFPSPAPSRTTSPQRTGPGAPGDPPGPATGESSAESPSPPTVPTDTGTPSGEPGDIGLHRENHR